MPTPALALARCRRPVRAAGRGRGAVGGGGDPVASKRRARGVRALRGRLPWGAAAVPPRCHPRPARPPALRPSRAAVQGSGDAALPFPSESPLPAWPSPRGARRLRGGGQVGDGPLALRFPPPPARPRRPTRAAHHWPPTAAAAGIPLHRASSSPPAAAEPLQAAPSARHARHAHRFSAVSLAGAAPSPPPSLLLSLHPLRPH